MIADRGAPAGGSSAWRIIVSSLVGTTIEFYDFYAYATAAISVFPLLFFRTATDTGALLASLATFGVAFVARPVGSVLFGHFGDRAGRKATLVASLLTMGIATVLIGLLPTYEAVGIAAPAFLALMRFCQGLGLGGEWSGASLLAGENSRPGKRGFDSMWPQLGAPIGFLLANGFFLLLTVAMDYDSTTAPSNHVFLAWGWRLPFLFSAVIVVLGLWVRFTLDETPSFRRAQQRGDVVKAPVVEVFRTSWGPLVRGTFLMVATYTLLLPHDDVDPVLLDRQGRLRPPRHRLPRLPRRPAHHDLRVRRDHPDLGHPRRPLGAQALPHDRHRRHRALRGQLRLLPEPREDRHRLRANLVRMTVFMLIGMALMGLTFGIQSALLPELFPTNVRYTGSAISYNVASILGASVAPFIAAWLAGRFGPGAVGLYLIAMALCTLASLVTMRETKDLDLDTVGRDGTVVVVAQG